MMLPSKGDNPMLTLNFFFFFPCVCIHNTGSGFRSLKTFNSGFFGIRMKLPNKDTTGIITTFYVSISFFGPLSLG